MHKLSYGETPWDKWSREDLLREVQRQHVALTAARTVLRFAKIAALQQEVGPGPYWTSPDGTGGRALALVEACEPEGFEHENVFRAFFRYAADLLFPEVPGAGSAWQVCDTDNTMWGRVRSAEPVATACGLCGGPLRPIQWSDLDPGAIAAPVPRAEGPEPAEAS